MTNYARGTAMIETAIVLSTALLVIFGAMQLGIAGYYQASTEGAAFVGAHAASVNSSGSADTDKTYGLSVANTAFPAITDFTLTYPQTNIIQVIVKRNAGGLLLVPGAAAKIATSAGVIEPILANSAFKGTTTSGFAAQAKLTNYCAGAGFSCSTRTIYLAEFDNIDGNGNGSNGQFAEWNCRPGLFPPYPGGYFPSAMPAGGGVNTQYDPASTGKGKNSTAFGGTSTEAQLYAFDTSTNKWGTQSSC